MSHIKPLSPRPGYDENGVYLHNYDPKYLDPRYDHLTEEQKEAADAYDNYCLECQQGRG